MGDRGNIVIEKDGENFTEDVYFYTHWAGSCIKGILQDALHRGKDRWDDPPYLARIIFCQMVGQSDLGGTSGFGISTILTDNEHDLLCVEMEKRRVVLRDAKTRAEKQSWSFEEFLEAKFKATGEEDE